MELVPGHSLEKYVDTIFMFTLTDEHSMPIQDGIAQGLQWLHKKALLYNNLKAE
ncbi:hypothetical protein LTR47_012065, partial [Exophiala xenobiotica]